MAAKKKHWTQLSQAKRGSKPAIRDDGDTNATATTWFRRNDRKRYHFLGWTSPTGIRRGIFLNDNRSDFVKDLKLQGMKRISYNDSIRESDVKRDYKAGKMFNRVVYRLK